MALRRVGALGGKIQRSLQQQGQPAEGLVADLSKQTGLPALLDGAKNMGNIRHASQLAVKQRMRSVQNIAKITSAMKMVAASKMRVAQINTEKSRGLLTPFLKLLGDLPAVEVETNVAVPVTTDKGLCGGINSTVSKYARGTLKAFNEEGQNSELVVIGEKGKAQLQRDQASHIKETIADVGKVRITFAQVSAIAEELMKTEYDAARIIFNRFHSAISFKPTVATVLSPDALEKEVESGGKLDVYEMEGPDRGELLQDLAEFQLAATLNNALLENNCSEQASRMSAMESSTKNAKEMLDKLTLSYNRTRQAAITTELTEIISGAAALEG
ncbi:ATP synthase subunit gamma, mitochondrial [Coccomyxa sp. Obi]|nr:ATP synthase subunit gamma, mitochondrial [Coccomyxa sp. Obi]